MNRKYRYFIFGDVHGEHFSMVSSLQDAGWDPNNPKHILISLGDNFDRGSENVKVYEFLNKYSVLNIFGNHESLLYEYLIGRSNGMFDCEHNGMLWTIEEFAGKRPILSHTVSDLFALRYEIINRHPELLKWLETIPNGYKIGNYILTHAGFENRYMIKDYNDTMWFPNEWTKSPKFVLNYKNTQDFKFIFGHWHAWRLTKEFMGIEDGKSHTFDYQNFIGLDAYTNITKRVNVYVIDSDHKAIPFAKSWNMETIKSLN